MRVYTFIDGVFSPGITVKSVEIGNPKTPTPAIPIGRKEKYNSEYQIVHVQLSEKQHKEWMKNNELTIWYANNSHSASGNYKIVAKENPEQDDSSIIVLFKENGNIKDESQMIKINAQGSVTNKNKITRIQSMSTIIKGHEFIIGDKHYIWDGENIINLT